LTEVLEPQRLGNGISIIPLPLPFRSPASVNSYVLEGGEGLTLIDCGADWESGHRALLDGLAALSLDQTAVETLIITHLHPDHVGMAPRLCREWGVRTVMHRRATALIDRYNDTPGFVARTSNLAQSHGVPATHRPVFIDIGERPDWMPPIDAPDLVVEDGDLIPIDPARHLEVLHTPGHEPAHICLRDTRTGILFAGDHILPGITPVIMFDEVFEDVLGEFLTSLARIRDLGVGITYPAHGGLIDRGALRAEQIILHHHRRLAGMEDVVVATSSTAWTVMNKVFRPHLSPQDQRLALRETVAHLEHLRISDRIALTDEGGLCWYRRH
jgi:glyoxylase-like metal-dependent hydrolase (beta-lactamase superfamily II)